MIELLAVLVVQGACDGAADTACAGSAPARSGLGFVRQRAGDWHERLKPAYYAMQALWGSW